MKNLAHGDYVEVVINRHRGPVTVHGTVEYKSRYTLLLEIKGMLREIPVSTIRTATVLPRA